MFFTTEWGLSCLSNSSVIRLRFWVEPNSAFAGALDWRKKILDFSSGKFQIYNQKSFYLNFTPHPSFVTIKTIIKLSRKLISTIQLWLLFLDGRLHWELSSKTNNVFFNYNWRCDSFVIWWKRLRHCNYFNYSASICCDKEKIDSCLNVKHGGFEVF